MWADVYLWSSYQTWAHTITFVGQTDYHRRKEKAIKCVDKYATFYKIWCRATSIEEWTQKQGQLRKPQCKKQLMREGARARGICQKIHMEVSQLPSSFDFNSCLL